MWGHEREWQLQAACVEADPELFFPPKGGSPARAKAICARCPVLKDCRAAIDTIEKKVGASLHYGVWAGETPGQRRQRRRRERANAALITV